MNGLVKTAGGGRPTKIGLEGINRALLYPKKRTTSLYSQKVMSQQHFQLRQNQLNSKFLLRKRRLERISKENKDIYIKIHCQKSKYPKDEMNKSYRSSREISKRLERGKALSRAGSTSRISQLSRDNSFATRRKPPISYRTPAKPIFCETLDINKLDDKKVLDMKIMFGSEKEQCRRPTSPNKQNPHFQKYTLPTLEQRTPGILTERNKFDTIKQQMEDKHHYKTIPVKRVVHRSKKFHTVFPL